MSEQDTLVGKEITAVHLADDRGAIRFDIKGGEPVVARCDGDCCSSTWIEHVEGPEQLIGCEVLAVEDINMPEGAPTEHREFTDVVAYYGLKITTSKGDTILDYRNDSNGYYGGNLSWPDDRDFYGGVHGQNVSTQQWKQIA